MSGGLKARLGGLLTIIMGLALLACSPSHRLKEYIFQEQTVTAVMDAPRPAVFTEGFAGFDPDDLLGTAVRAGTALAREITADGAQARLDSAMNVVDIPGRIRERTLERCSGQLGLWPVHDPDRSDFLLDLFIHSYGIEARSWESRVSFQMDLEVLLLDNTTGAAVWKTRVKEREPLTGGVFVAASLAAGDIVTAVALSQLSAEEMAAGLEVLADGVADQVVQRLRRDYAQSRPYRQPETKRMKRVEKRDVVAELRYLYRPSAEKVSIVDVPPMNFLMIDGAGDPNTSGEYQNAVQTLYQLSYAIKEQVRAERRVDYQVMPLEGLWWADQMGQFSMDNKDDWKWTAMIMQPYFVTDQMIADAAEQMSGTAALPALDQVRFEPYAEGTCAQTLHIGPYAAEGPTIVKIHQFLSESGHQPRGKHHEIYLTDPSTTPPQENRTIIRQPFE